MHILIIENNQNYKLNVEFYLYSIIIYYIYYYPLLY